MTKTTCDWTVERLPWWVNGTLEEAEAQRVEAHLAECAACRDELEATRGALALYGAHLPIEALLELVEAETGEREAGGSSHAAGGAVLSSEAVAAHLGHCPPCREQLALLRESRAAVEGESAAREPAGATVTPFAPRRAQTAPPLRRHRLDRRSLELAASLLFCVVAAGGWLASGWTAERRADQIEELDRRLADATAAQAADAPSGAEATEGAADEASPALDAAVAENAELKAEVDQLRQEQAGGERVADGAGVGVTEPWDLQRTVMRGGPTQPEGRPIEVPAGEEQLSLYLTGMGNEPLALVVDDAAGRRRPVRDSLTAVESADFEPHRTVTLPLADLPTGEWLTLRLLADGEVIASRPLRIAR